MMQGGRGNPELDQVGSPIHVNSDILTVILTRYAVS